MVTIRFLRTWSSEYELPGNSWCTKSDLAPAQCCWDLKATWIRMMRLVQMNFILQNVRYHGSQECWAQCNTFHGQNPKLKSHTRYTHFSPIDHLYLLNFSFSSIEPLHLAPNLLSSLASSNLTFHTIIEKKISPKQLLNATNFRRLQRTIQAW